jgi:hypothetical protein
VLSDHGVTHHAAHGHILEAKGEGITTSPAHIPFLPASRQVLRNALRSALDFGVNYINSGHVLHSLLADDPSSVPVANHAITNCGVTYEALNDRLTELLTEAGSVGFRLEARDNPDHPRCRPSRSLWVLT